MNILLALLLSAIPPPPGVYANGYAPETIFMDGGLDMTGNAVFFDPTNSQVFLAWDAGSNGLDLTLGGSFLNVQGGPAVINNVEINGNQLTDGYVHNETISFNGNNGGPSNNLFLQSSDGTIVAATPNSTMVLNEGGNGLATIYTNTSSQLTLNQNPGDAYIYANNNSELALNQNNHGDSYVYANNSSELALNQNNIGDSYVYASNAAEIALNQNNNGEITFYANNSGAGAYVQFETPAVYINDPSPLVFDTNPGSPQQALIMSPNGQDLYNQATGIYAIDGGSIFAASQSTITVIDDAGTTIYYDGQGNLIISATGTVTIDAGIFVVQAYDIHEQENDAGSYLDLSQGTASLFAGPNGTTAGANFQAHVDGSASMNGAFLWLDAGDRLAIGVGGDVNVQAGNTFDVESQGATINGNSGNTNIASQNYVNLNTPNGVVIEAYSPLYFGSAGANANIMSGGNVLQLGGTAIEMGATAVIMQAGGDFNWNDGPSIGTDGAGTLSIDSTNNIQVANFGHELYLNNINTLLNAGSPLEWSDNPQIDSSLDGGLRFNGDAGFLDQAGDLFLNKNGYIGGGLSVMGGQLFVDAGIQVGYNGLPISLLKAGTCALSTGACTITDPSVTSSTVVTCSCLGSTLSGCNPTISAGSGFTLTCNVTDTNATWWRVN